MIVLSPDPPAVPITPRFQGHQFNALTAPLCYLYFILGLSLLVSHITTELSLEPEAMFYDPPVYFLRAQTSPLCICILLMIVYFILRSCEMMDLSLESVYNILFDSVKSWDDILFVCS